MYSVFLWARRELTGLCALTLGRRVYDYLQSPRRSWFDTALLPHRDLPPSGGYQPIRYKRNLPGKNLSGLTIFGGVIAICAYGFYKVGQGNLEQR